MAGNQAYQKAAYKDEPWEELVNGEIVAMSPRPLVNHNRVAGNIYHIFRNYLKGKLCEPFADGTDLYLPEKDRFVPDGMVVCDKDKIKADGIHGAPDLVVEILSPGTEKRDRGYKKDVYERAGVREYWIVSPYPAYRNIEVYRLLEGKFILDGVYRLYSEYDRKDLGEEVAGYPVEFTSSLFDDLTILLEDVFYRVV